MKVLLLCCLGLIPLIAQEAAKPAQPEAAPPQAPAEKPAAAAQEPAAAEPARAAAGVLTGSVDFGYRWRTDVSGNFNAYRSVVDLGEGPKVFGFDLNLISPDRKYYDKVSLFGLGWGGEPYSTVRLNATKERVYDFYADYRNLEYFNYLPSYADPLLAINGAILNERAYDVRRRMFDTELRFRPGTRLIPYFAYSRNWGGGAGTTTFVASSNEYPVWNRLDDSTDRYLGGVSIELKNYHLTLEQGGLKFSDNQNTAFSGTNYGNRLTPIFGRQLLLTDESQVYDVTGSAIFSRALVSGTPLSWLYFSGQFLYSQPQTDTRFEQRGAGNFVNLQTISFFNTQQDVISAAAKQPHTSGDFNLTISPFSRLRLLETISTNRFHTASSLLASQLTNFTPEAVQNLAANLLLVNYNRQQFQVDFDVFKWLTLRAGHKYVWGDAGVTAPPLIGVDFERADLEQNAAVVGAQVRFGQKVWINADTEVGATDRNYFRTSLHDYKKFSVRARYQALSSLSFTANFTSLDNENPTTGVDYDFSSRQGSLAIFWNPSQAKRISFTGEYTRSTLASNINYINPLFGGPELSHYVDDAHAATALLDVVPVGGTYGPRISAGGSYFKSTGTRPTGYYQPIAKLSVPLHERVQFFTEWRWYSLTEDFYRYEGFRTHVFVAGLRVAR
jgi:hypothetical protein